MDRNKALLLHSAHSDPLVIVAVPGFPVYRFLPCRTGDLPLPLYQCKDFGLHKDKEVMLLQI